MRYRHLVRTDPDGSWVAEDEHGIAGCALALRREDVWGLSLLIVRPELQSAGVGGAAAAPRARLRRRRPRPHHPLLARPARDPRLLAARPRDRTRASGPRARRAASPIRPRLRVGTRDDIPFTEAVDRHVRGAAHGADIGVQLEMGQTLLIAARPRLRRHRRTTASCASLAAFDDDSARELLRAALARVGDREVSVSWLIGRRSSGRSRTASTPGSSCAPTHGARLRRRRRRAVHALPPERRLPVSLSTRPGTWSAGSP